MKIAVLVLWLALLANPTPAWASEQELVLGPQFVQRFDELGAWVREYYAWETWFEQWGNRVAKNFDNQPVWDRKKRPQPPIWLEDECRDYLDVDGLLAIACNILRNWDAEPLRILQRRNPSLVTSGGQVDDKVVKSSFFKRVHLTGLWMRAQYPATPVYGIVGMQIGVFELGRYTLPAVGAMVVMIPDGEGGHAWKPATTLGFGYRIFDFVAPVLKKQVSLHINIARTSIHGVQDQRFLPGSHNFTFVGLSVSRKRGR